MSLPYQGHFQHVELKAIQALLCELLCGLQVTQTRLKLDRLYYSIKYGVTHDQTYLYRLPNCLNQRREAAAGQLCFS